MRYKGINNLRFIVVKNLNLASLLSQKALGLALIFTLLLPFVASAAPNYQINYQGKLNDSAGDPVTNGDYDITFSLYTASSGGSAIWTEAHTSADDVTVTDGLFSVMLGSITSLSSVNFNQTLYLGVTVESDSEMTPRKILGAVPAAFEADRLDGLTSADFISTSTTALPNVWSASGLGQVGSSTATTTFLGNLAAAGSSIFNGILTVFDRVTSPYFVATSTSQASVFPYASTTMITATTASTTNLIISGLGSGLTKVTNGVVGLATAGTDYLTSAFQNWQISGGYLTPTTTQVVKVDGLISTASSTVSGVLTVTGNGIFNDRLYAGGASSGNFVGKLNVGDSSNDNGWIFDTDGEGANSVYIGRVHSSGSSVVIRATNNGVNFPNDRVGLGTTTPGTLLSLGNTGNSTINITPSGTSTFGLGIDLRGGCYAINGACLTLGNLSGIVGISNGGTNASALNSTQLLYFDGTRIAGTSTPTASYFMATSTSLASVFPYASTTALTVSGAGNVNIDTTNTSPLTISSTLPRIILTDSTAGDDDFIISPNSDYIEFLSGSLRDILVINGETRTSGAGYVGIGTTTPSAQLAASTTSGIGLMIDQRGTSDIFRLLDAGTNVFTVQDGGNVGIGTSTPQAILSSEVNGNAFGLLLTQSGATSRRKIGFGLDTDVKQWQLGTDLSNDGSDNFWLWARNGTGPSAFVQTWMDNGNIGFGTTTPGTLLSLGNTGNSTINITPSGTSTFGLGINLRGGCYAINNTCISSGSASLSGGTAGMLAAWTSSSALTATGTPNFDAFNATSTAATSTIAGGLAIQTSGLVYDFSSNNVGIGTAAAKNALAISRSQSGLTTVGNARVLTLLNSSGSTNQLQEIGFGFQATSGNYSQPVVIGHRVTSGSSNSMGDFYIATRSVTTDTFPTERLTVTAAGDVGVGTSSPQAKLAISGGNILLENNRFLSAYKNGGAVVNLIGINTSSQTQIDSGSGNNMVFRPSGSTAVTFSSAGLVGIGTTSPDYLLTIGDGGATGNNKIAIDSAANRQNSISFRSAGVDKWFIGRGDSDVLSDSSFFIGNTSGGTVNDPGGASAKLTINPSGLVGIGTSTSATTEGILHIADNSNGAVNTVLSNTNSGTAAFATYQVRNGGSLAEGIRLGVTGTGFTTTGGFIQDGGFLSSGTNISGGLSLITQGSAPIRFYTNGHTNERMQITSGGLVGVGTTTPGTLLSLGDTGNSTINITPSGTSTFGLGINLRGGCYAINNTCISGSGGSGSGTVNSGTADYVAYYPSTGTAVSYASGIKTYAFSSSYRGTAVGDPTYPLVGSTLVPQGIFEVGYFSTSTFPTYAGWHDALSINGYANTGDSNSRWVDFVAGGANSGGFGHSTMRFFTRGSESNPSLALTIEPDKDVVIVGDLTVSGNNLNVTNSDSGLTLNSHLTIQGGRINSGTTTIISSAFDGAGDDGGTVIIAKGGTGEDPDEGDGGTVNIASGGNGIASGDSGGNGGTITMVAGGLEGGGSGTDGSDGTVNIGNSASTKKNATLNVYGTIGVMFRNTATTNGVCHSGTDLDTTDTTNSYNLVACSAAPGDVAEMYSTYDDVEAGDIVAMGDDTITYEASGGDPYSGQVHSLGSVTVNKMRRAEAGDVAIAGIISTAPFQTFGKDVLKVDSNAKPLALAGRVPVKVNMEGGEIKAGDNITLSSVPGVGKKATSSAVTVGMALQDYDGPGEGKVLVLVNLGYSRVDNAISNEGLTSDTIWTIDEDTGRIKSLASLDLNNQELVNVKSIASASGNWSIAEDGTLTVKKVQTDELCIGSICVDEERWREILESAGIDVDDTPEVNEGGGDSNGNNDNGTTTDDGTGGDDNATSTPPAEEDPELESPTGDETPTDNGGATSEPEPEESEPEPTPEPEPELESPTGDETPTDSGGAEPAPTP